MWSIRRQYDGLWDAICNYVYPEPGYRSVKEPDDDGPAFGLVKNTWPVDTGRWPSGFYICGISFENLCLGEGAPYACIWIRLSKPVGVGYLENARKRLREEAKRAFGREPQEEQRASVITLFFDLPSREVLLAYLTKNGGRAFVEIMVSHLKKFRSLIPVIDGVFNRRVKRGK